MAAVVSAAVAQTLQIPQPLYNVEMMLRAQESLRLTNFLKLLQNSAEATATCTHNCREHVYRSRRRRSWVHVVHCQLHYIYAHTSSKLVIPPVPDDHSFSLVHLRNHILPQSHP